MILVKNKTLLLLIEILFSFSFVQLENVENSKGLLNVLFGSCNKCRCGVPNRDAKLIGGEYLRSYEFPWLALIHIKNQTVVGSLINNRYILTAATPLIGLPEHEIKVSLGQFDRCSPDITSMNVSVESINIHPEYGSDNRANDVALLRTSSVIRFERNISPICLPTPGINYLGQVATATNWFEQNNKITCRPRKVGLPVLDREVCLGTASSPHTISIDKGCIGVIGASSTLCTEDVGSPIMYRSYGGIYEIIGVTNDKNDCSSTPSTSTFTKINNHMPWIVTNTKKSCYCIKT